MDEIQQASDGSNDGSQCGRKLILTNLKMPTFLVWEKVDFKESKNDDNLP